MLGLPQYTKKSRIQHTQIKMKPSQMMHPRPLRNIFDLIEFHSYLRDDESANVSACYIRHEGMSLGFGVALSKPVKFASLMKSNLLLTR